MIRELSIRSVMLDISLDALGHDRHGRLGRFRDSAGSDEMRRRVPTPEGDRPISGACETLARWVTSGEISRLTEEVLES